jgi:putative membrane protein
VALIGFGFTIVQFFERLGSMPGVTAAQRPQAPRYLGLALIGMGVAVLIVSALQYRRVVHYLWSKPFEPVAGVWPGSERPVILQTPLMAVTIFLTLVGVFAFGAVLLRAV